MAERKPKVMKVEKKQVNLSDPDALIPGNEEPVTDTRTVAERNAANEAVRQEAKAKAAALRGGMAPL